MKAHKEKSLALKDYNPKYANVKVSGAAMWKHLGALEAIAHDPAQVKVWISRVWGELDECEVC